MSVRFYAEGEHPAGFVGYRVATTVGDAKEYRQAYFSLNQYSPDVAHDKAHTLHNKWRQQADDRIRQRRIECSVRADDDKAALIATNFRARIHVDKGKKPSQAIRFVPQFVVSRPGHGRSSRSFSLKTYGLDQAFLLALDFYCSTYEVSDADRDLLLSRKPDSSLFTVTLRDRLLERGHQLSMAAIISMIGD